MHGLSLCLTKINMSTLKRTYKFLHFKFHRLLNTPQPKRISQLHKISQQERKDAKWRSKNGEAPEKTSRQGFPEKWSLASVHKRRSKVNSVGLLTQV
jgi:hypothetical protein